MRKIIFLCIGLLSITSCVDQKLSLSRTSNTTSKIRLDGFYYSRHEGDKPSYGISFFYQDGTVFHAGIASEEAFKDIGQFIAEHENFRRNTKESWGLYQISGNRFIMEGWNSSVGGGLPRYRKEGLILNDSTILLTEYRGYENKSPKIETIESGYLYFRPYLPKPDSTNHFIPHN